MYWPRVGILQNILEFICKRHPLNTLWVLLSQFSRIHPFPSLATKQSHFSGHNGFCMWVLREVVHHTKSSQCWLCSMWKTPCSAEAQTCPYWTGFLFPPQAGAQRPSMQGTHFPCFIGKEMKAESNTTIRQGEPIHCVAAGCKIWNPKALYQAEHSENQWLSLQQTFKYNACVIPSKTKLILYFYNNSYTAVSTEHTPISFAKQQSGNSNSSESC